ncbi:MAG: nucleoside-triphosphatase [Elusimicrobiales bacterium]|jgi:nucleoside-triphosphatase THEP1
MDFKKNIALRVGDEALKSRLISRLAADYSYWLGGFFTVEIRSGSAREGFMLRTPDGRSEIMASKAILSPVSFNKYGVDLRALDGLAAHSLAGARKNGKIALLDELGPLTLQAKALAAAVLETLASDTPCLVTFRRGAGRFSAAFFKMADTEVLDLSASGLPGVRSRLDGWMEFWIGRLKAEG